MQNRDDLCTLVCFLDFQEMIEFPKKKMQNPERDGLWLVCCLDFQEIIEFPRKMQNPK